ncbi:protein Mis18-alpha-like [Zophobas morio]|uniref:protein Mis18-alpha-like n=1 Tax=Zophobas morio TaxID=2755281 RepID=UPI003083EC9B
MLTTNEESPVDLVTSKDELVSQAPTPIVFQCKNCRVIIGDSFQWVSNNETLNLITLQALSRVVEVSNIMETSRDGEDIGSTFFVLNCGKCRSFLGRKYITSSRELDSLRDLYSLDVSAIDSYQLGTFLIEDGQQTNFKATPSVCSLHTQQLKMERVLLTLNERISNLKEKLEKLKSTVELRRSKRISLN